MYNYEGIKERFNQLKNASDSIKLRGLRSLDKIISLELEEAEERQQINTLLTYRRKTRMELRNLIGGM